MDNTETIVFDLLNDLDIALIVPLGPESEADIDLDETPLPAISYRRKATPEIGRDLDGIIRFYEYDFEIVCYGENFQETNTLANAVVDELDNLTTDDGYEFALTDQRTDDILFSMHLSFHVFRAA